MQFFQATAFVALLSTVSQAAAFLVIPSGTTLNIIPSSLLVKNTRTTITVATTTALQMAMDESMANRLTGIKRSYQALTERLGDPDVVNDSNLLRKVMSERSSIEETVLAYDEYCTLQEELEGAKELFQAVDAEMKEMAREEIKEIEPKMADLEEKIKILLLPKDPNDDRNIMLEIRAGTGGSEANIFAGRCSLLFMMSFCEGERKHFLQT